MHIIKYIKYICKCYISISIIYCDIYNIHSIIYNTNIYSFFRLFSFISSVYTICIRNCVPLLVQAAFYVISLPTKCLKSQR